jgi:hypothetical protein
VGERTRGDSLLLEMIESNIRYGEAFTKDMEQGGWISPK